MLKYQYMVSIHSEEDKRRKKMEKLSSQMSVGKNDNTIILIFFTGNLSYSGCYELSSTPNYNYINIGLHSVN